MNNDSPIEVELTNLESAPANIARNVCSALLSVIVDVPSQGTGTMNNAFTVFPSPVIEKLHTIQSSALEDLLERGECNSNPGSRDSVTSRASAYLTAAAPTPFDECR